MRNLGLVVILLSLYLSLTPAFADSKTIPANQKFEHIHATGKSFLDCSLNAVNRFFVDHSFQVMSYLNHHFVDEEQLRFVAKIKSFNSQNASIMIAAGTVMMTKSTELTKCNIQFTPITYEKSTADGSNTLKDPQALMKVWNSTDKNWIFYDPTITYSAVFLRN